jgi:hypothetical protein
MPRLRECSRLSRQNRVRREIEKQLNMALASRINRSIAVVSSFDHTAPLQ